MRKVTLINPTLQAKKLRHRPVKSPKIAQLICDGSGIQKGNGMDLKSTLLTTYLIIPKCEQDPKSATWPVQQMTISKKESNFNVPG